MRYLTNLTSFYFVRKIHNVATRSYRRDNKRLQNWIETPSTRSRQQTDTTKKERNRIEIVVRKTHIKIIGPDKNLRFQRFINYLSVFGRFEHISCCSACAVVWFSRHRQQQQWLWLLGTLPANTYLLCALRWTAGCVAKMVLARFSIISTNSNRNLHDKLRQRKLRCTLRLSSSSGEWRVLVCNFFAGMSNEAIDILIVRKSRAVNSCCKVPNCWKKLYSVLMARSNRTDDVTTAFFVLNA